MGLMVSNSLVGTLITARCQISTYQSVSSDNMLVNSVMVGDETVFADIFLRWEGGGGGGDIQTKLT